MEFRVLGTVAVVTEYGRPLPLGPAKRRSLLAMLLLSPNTAVSVERLTEALWDGEPPRHFRTMLQSHVCGLRAAFAGHGASAHGVELVTQGRAYALTLPAALVDAHRFEQGLRLARAQREPAEVVPLLREALALWRGPALTGTLPHPPLQNAAHVLDELRLTAVEELAAAHGLTGEHTAAAAVLRAEAAANPLRESLIAALVLALGRAGRRPDALELFHRTRRLLGEQLGIGPGAALADAYATLLAEDAPGPSRARVAVATRPAGSPSGGPADRPATRPPTGRPAGPGEPGPPEQPAQPGHPAEPSPVPAVPHPGTPGPQLLPRRPRGFTGRGSELAALDRAAADAPDPIVMITGSAGVGKTALAVHWAHRHRAAFPDGRLFADLHGYSPLPARETTDVLRDFLLVLGVPTERMPGSPESLAARYRELTTGRRMLVVLDNARDAGQIRPLLPGGEDCLTLVTSRDRLAELVASDAARPVPLAELPTAQSTDLLAAVLGREVIDAEPEPAARLAGLCGGLPLALRVAAARLATRPHRGLAAFADELADEHTRLDLLNVGSTGVAAALGLTVQHLPVPARQLFHRLGPHTGGTLDTPTAAALAGCLPSQAATALDQLAAAQLVVETAPHSYVLHDLVRLYARSLSPGHDAEALLRLLDHWLQTLIAAVAAAEPGSEPCCDLPADLRRAAAVRRFSDRTNALAWFSAERDTLRGAVEAAVAAGLHGRAWRLVLLQWPLILWQVRDGWEPLLRQGLTAAERDESPGGQSRARALLGWVLTEEGRHGAALAELERAPGLAALARDPGGEATALLNLAEALMRHGDRDRPRALLLRALALAEEIRAAGTLALAHLHLARYRLSVGAPEAALGHAVRGLALAAPPHPAPRRVLLRTLYGEALAGTGRTDEAVRQLRDAIEEARTHAYEAGETAARAVLTTLVTDGS
ncbi:BTAD domain-containing putative transcriptional regulator [Streptomyces sp. NPDC018045]|uniref:AfsR/SARP family transcriptional regulator n=1 Tax=Streptomyces sp. NPDC018045 TaxID=3365037 RepID=UPI0037961C2A